MSAFTPDQARELKQVFKDSLNEVFRETECTICPISKESREEMGHFMGMVRDIGEDNLNKGIETIRENHKFVRKLNSASNKIGMIVLTFLIITVCGGIVTAVVHYTTKVLGK